MSWKSPIIRVTDVPLHVYNRGVNRETIFFCASDFERFLGLLFENLTGSDVQLLAYVLLPNHFHLILHQAAEYAVSTYMQKVCWQYSCYLNRRRRRTGHLFESRFKPRQIYDDKSLLRLSHYLHNNPVSAGLVPKAESWKYSSMRGYQGKAKTTALSSEQILTLVNGPANYSRFMNEYDSSQPESVCKFIHSGNHIVRRKVPRQTNPHIIV